MLSFDHLGRFFCASLGALDNIEFYHKFSTNIIKLKNVEIWENIKRGRLPYESLNLPKIGLVINWKSEKVIRIVPMINGDAPKSFAYKGKNGKTNENPKTSVTWIRKITIYSFLNFIVCRGWN